MPYQTVKRSTKFIDSVKLPRRAPASARRSRGLAPPAAPVELQDKTAQAVVAGSGLIFAEEGVAKQVKEDLLTCTLFAQFAAQAKVGSATKAVEWYEAYFDALRNLGWAMSSQEFREHTESGRTVLVHKAIMGVLSAVLGPAATALVVIKSVFDGLEQVGSENGWLTFFDRQSVEEKVAKFQVVTAQPAKDGQINVGLVGFELVAQRTITQVLFFKSSKSEVHLRFTGGSATIFEPVLAQVRGSLQQKLGAVTADFVNSIPIPARPRGLRAARGRTPPAR
jgi:hypothetical protein